MKTTFTLFLALLSSYAFAQDTITDKAGNTYEVKILEENSDNIVYKINNGNPVSVSKKNLKGFAYAPGSRPEKKNNTIVLSTHDDQATAMRKLVSILSDQGYGIQTIDKDLGILTTTSKGYKGGTTSLSIQIREEDNTKIIMRGMLDGIDLTIYGATVDGKANIEYRGMSNSPMMNAWLEMEKVAKAYADAEISYTTK